MCVEKQKFKKFKWIDAIEIEREQNGEECTEECNIRTIEQRNAENNVK